MKFTFADISRYRFAIGLLCLATFELLQAQQGPRRLVISAATQAISTGQTQSLTVKATSIRGPQSSAPFKGKIRWISSDNTIATVPSGVMTANASNTGLVRITAVSGPASGSIMLAVVPNQPLTGLVISPKPPNPGDQGSSTTI